MRIAAEPAAGETNGMNRQTLGLRLIVWGGAAAAFLIWRPEHDGILRYGMVAAAAVMWAGLLVICWRPWPRRAAPLALLPIAAIPFLLPAKELDRDALRKSYVAGMRGFEGCSYVWGGESARGIDCSGLPRRALRDALRIQALHGNGTAARLWLEQWWFDTSARALKAGYRDFTRPTGVEGWLQELDFESIEAGDLAVTDDGRHVLIYLGEGEWTQADPGPGRVLTARPHRDDNPWFASRVSIHRWMILDPPVSL